MQLLFVSHAGVSHEDDGVSEQDLQSLCLAHPQVALKVLRGARLRRLVGIIDELSFTTVRHPRALFLLRLARTEGKRTGDGVEVTLPVSNRELASQIGTVRELVSRNLSRFQFEGLVRIDGRSVIIHDPKALEAEIESCRIAFSEPPNPKFDGFLQSP